MADDFLIWTAKMEPRACRVLGMEGYDEGFRLRRGDSVLGDWPGDVTFTMNPDFPDDRLLVDAVMNPSSAIVASPRLAGAMAERAPGDVELLPVRIIDHKCKLASAEYVVVHPVKALDAVDRERSVFDLVYNSPLFDSFSRLVIDPTRVPPERQIFRLQGVWRLIVARRELVQVIEGLGLKGVGWTPASAYSDDN
jgi:hypothetical protein